MIDFKNYVCDGQIELEDYLKTLEDKESTWEKKDVSSDVSGSREKTTLRQVGGAEMQSYQNPHTWCGDPQAGGLYHHRSSP